MVILKFFSNSKYINLIAVIEMIAHATLHVIGSKTAKYHFIGWMFWLIILTLARVYYFGTHRFHNDR